MQTPWARQEWERFPLDTKIELTEGQVRLRNAAKYLYKRWSTTPIRYADINDKLAHDKLIWLVHNYHEPEVQNFAVTLSDKGAEPFAAIPDFAV